ncbi:MAG: peptide ABC transporter substrate-binding protein [Candidatus Dormibacteraeota bacterium]|nr:peptide ABC transporter substrate-binding protein [Candidatus Dormibacteraeota bacterium]
MACGNTGTGNTSNATLSDYKPQAGAKGGQLVYSDWEPVDDLNMISSTAATTQQAGLVIWAQLWQFDGKNAPYPDMVTAVPSTDNGLVKQIDSTHMDVTLRLKSGLKWSDGSPITADDVKFTIEAICNTDTGAASQSGYDHIATMDVKGTTDLILHFGPTKKGYCGLAADNPSGIYASFVTDMDFNTMPKSVLGAVKNADWATNDYFTKKPTVTSGPYMVQNFTPGPAAQVVMVPNPHYGDGRGGAQFFGHAPYLDKLIYKIYGDKSSQIAGIKSGDTDLGLDLIAKDLDALNSASNAKIVHATGLLDEFLSINQGNNSTGCDSQQFAATCGKPTPFANDKPLRQALDLAIDKDAMNTQLVGGIGKTMNGPFVSALVPYYDTSIPAFKMDVAKANSLLDGDGWTKAADGTRSKNGQKLVFAISTTSGNPQRAAEEELLINNWKAIGATVTTKNFPAGKYFGAYKSGGILATGQYDIGLYANNWSADPSGWCLIVQSDQIPSTANPSGQNWSRTNDPKLDSACKAGANTVDVNKRIAAYKDVQAAWRDTEPLIQMYERPDVFAHATYFGNFAPTVNTCLAVCNATDWFKVGGKA